MKVVITGGAGFVGRKLATRLLEKNSLDLGGGKSGAVDKVTVFDVGEPDPPFPPDPRLDIVTGDVSDIEMIRKLITPDIDAVFNLAAVVSAGAEADFDLGMRGNLGGTRAVLDVCRQLGTVPRVCFASSVAGFGGNVPDVIRDDTHLTPQTSYGAQKAMGELLINDYSRKGFIDGRALRLPTVVVRPGKPQQGGFDLRQFDHQGTAAGRLRDLSCGAGAGDVAVIAAPGCRCLHPRRRTAGGSLGVQPRGFDTRHYPHGSGDGRCAGRGRGEEGDGTHKVAT